MTARYRHAIDEFVDWYCSEPRLAFNKQVVVRYRMHPDSRHLAPRTINLRLGAVRRLAYLHFRPALDCSDRNARNSEKLALPTGCSLRIATNHPKSRFHRARLMVTTSLSIHAGGSMTSCV